MCIRVGLIVVLLVAGAAGASAQASSYEDLVREAVSEFERGNFIEARTLFEQAHAQKPSARTLRGLGLTSYELKHYVQAINELQAATTDTRNPLDAKKLAEANEVIVKAKRYVATLVLEVTPSEAAVTIDGRAVEVRQIALDAGEHAIAARAQGYRENEQHVTLTGGQTVTLHLDLAPLELSPTQVAAASPAAAPAQPVTSDRAADDGGGSVLEKWWFWTAAGVIVAGAAVGTAIALSGGTETAAPNTGTTHVKLNPPR